MILYAPYIEGTIPAFAGSKLRVPFEMNPAISPKEIDYMAVRILDLNNNIIEGSPVIQECTMDMLNNRILTFSLWLTLEQDEYYKIQVAFLNKKDDTPTYSTTGITKWLGKTDPTIAIKTFNINQANPHRYYYEGEYDSQSSNEEEYSYRFVIRNCLDEIVYDSGEVFHLQDTPDHWVIKRDFSPGDGEGSITYTITTVNGYSTSKRYKLVSNARLGYSPEMGATIVATANSEEGCIDLDISTTWTLDTNKMGIYQIVKSAGNGEWNSVASFETSGKGEAYPITDTSIKISSQNPAGLRDGTIYWNSMGSGSTMRHVALKQSLEGENTIVLRFEPTTATVTYNLYGLENLKYTDDTGGKTLLATGNISPYNYVNTHVVKMRDPYFYLSIRMNENNYYSSDIVLKQIIILSDDNKGKTLYFKDYDVEQGQTYYYNYLQVNRDETVFSKKGLEKSVISTADFEDTFLSDNERSVKIKFNPKVSSFKTTIAESKTDTIGGKYPYIFRNGASNYKEIPISGLISYQMDEILEPDGRGQTPSATTAVEKDEFYLERKYKLELLDWLNNGKPKLFRSPGEGNYIIRLMNVSLSPEDKLGRLIHSFSATGYEVANYNVDNLSKYGLISCPFEGYQLETTSKVETITLYKADELLSNGFYSISKIFIEGAMPGDKFEIDGAIITIGETGNYTAEADIKTIKQLATNSGLGYITIYGEVLIEETPLSDFTKAIGIQTELYIGTKEAAIDNLENSKIYELRFRIKEDSKKKETTVVINGETIDLKLCPNGEYNVMYSEIKDINELEIGADAEYDIVYFTNTLILSEESEENG